jgi:alpha-galactosidase
MANCKAPELAPRLLALGLLAAAVPAAALDNGVGRTPALGWSSWNYFENDINETLVLGIAGAIASTGLRELGYEYINLDAGAWSPNRTAGGEMQPDPAK